MEHSPVSFQSSVATIEEVQPFPAVEAEQIQETAVDLSTAALEGTSSRSNSSQSQSNTALRTFFSTFFTIFLAEIGDKTQLTTLLMAAESHKPWVVFIGAGAALVATSLIGVWLGCWLSKRVSPRTLETAAGTLLLLISALLVWDIIQL